MISLNSLFLILAISWCALSQNFAGIVSYTSPNCTGGAFSQNYMINTCMSSSTKFITVSCHGTSGYTVTTCDDGLCFVNCTQSTTTGYGECTTVGNFSFSSYCNSPFQREKNDMITSYANNCTATPYMYAGSTGCAYNSKSRAVCRNSTTVTAFTFQSGCSGIYTAVNNDLTVNCFSGLTVTCPRFYPDCYGKNSLLEPTTVCGGVGKCLGYNNCSCPSSHTGAECTIPITCFGVRGDDSKVCSGNGVCSGMDTCVCRDGWSGSTCSVPSCGGINATNPNACSGNGACSGLNTCTCNVGFFGATCNITSCAGIPATNPAVCSGNGTCTGLNTCSCNAGFFGVSCNVTSCAGISASNSTVCSSNGRCVDLNTCICNTGRTGTNCQNTSGAIQGFLSVLVVLVLFTIHFQ